MIKLKKARQYIEVFKERQAKSVHSIYELEINVKNYSWLLSFCNELSGELVESESTSDIHSELSGYSESLQEIIEIQLKRTLGFGLDKLLPESLLLLKMCREMNKMNLFEATFKMAIVYPSIENIYKETCENFQVFLRDSFVFIKELRGKLSVLQLKNDFLIKTILVPTISWITEKFPNVFIPTEGNLKEFKRNFENGLDFVSAIENEFFEYEDEIILFRNQAVWINFMKKWALHQYYQIITRKIMSKIETSLQEQRKNISASTGSKEVFKSTLVVIESLKLLWSDEIVLRPLIPKFLKMTIQIFRRFIHFCTEEDPFAYENPKLFLVSSLEKQFNLKHFMTEIGAGAGLEEELKKYLDPAITLQIMNQFKFECEESLKKSRGNLIPGIEKLYDRLLLKREDVNNLQLDALRLLKQEQEIISAEDYSDSVDPDHVITTILQGILLKFNRAIFKLIDEKRLNGGEKEILKKMKEVEAEVEAGELGGNYFKLENEEFWLEIKAALL